MDGCDDPIWRPNICRSAQSLFHLENSHICRVIRRASSFLSSPLIDIASPGWSFPIFMTCSKAREGYNVIQFSSLWVGPYFDPALQTGPFICFNHRTHH